MPSLQLSHSRHEDDVHGGGHDGVVITGVGVITSVGGDRESAWRAIQDGQSGVRPLTGLKGIADGLILGAPVDVPLERPYENKQAALAKIAADEALRDSRVDLAQVDRRRFGCAVSAHIGDTRFLDVLAGARTACEGGDEPDSVRWWDQFLPSSTCALLGNRHGLLGPRLSHSTACASGLVDVVAAYRAIRQGRCDVALAGSADAIHPVMAAGFKRMKVLAHHEDPRQACAPFDRDRRGFVLGEGSAMFVLERLDHALSRGAKIYAHISAARMLSEAHHVTGLDQESVALTRLITDTLQAAGLSPHELGYINAHGTGTQQNDIVESRGIRRALGAAAGDVCVSSTKSMIGHLINAAGSVELAVTVLALRDGFAPATLNLHNPDPECDLDCIPLVGRPSRFQHAMKLSVAFGGHLVAVTLRRWNDAQSGFSYPVRRAA